MMLHSDMALVWDKGTYTRPTNGQAAGGGGCLRIFVFRFRAFLLVLALFYIRKLCRFWVGAFLLRVFMRPKLLFHAARFALGLVFCLFGAWCGSRWSIVYLYAHLSLASPQISARSWRSTRQTRSCSSKISPRLSPSSSRWAPRASPPALRAGFTGSCSSSLP